MRAPVHYSRKRVLTRWLYAQSRTVSSIEATQNSLTRTITVTVAEDDESSHRYGGIMTTLGDSDNLSIRLSNILPAGYVSAYTHDLQGESEILGYGIVQTTLLLGPEPDGHFWLSETYPDGATHDVSIHV